MRVLYSFPHRLGAARICYTAWQQVMGLASAGAEVVLFAGSVTRPVPETVEVHTTLARGRFRIPYRVIGHMRAMKLHDNIVARQLRKLAGQIDLVHLWPGGALETIKAAKQLGIPTVLERPNAHTRFAWEVVAAEHSRIGIQTPHYDYQASDPKLQREEAEFEGCDFLLCPSEFTAKSFIDRGFSPDKILRHCYGFDEKECFPLSELRNPGKPFTAIFVGVDAVRKGLHLAMDAWLSSPACQNGTFSIAGDLNEEFKQRFAAPLSHPSIVQLGHRHDVPQLMQEADILVLPSIEEGFGLVCVEALGAGCVPLVSTACTETCRHMENALVHEVGDVLTLRKQITELYENPALLARLRAGALASRDQLTWSAAGRVLNVTYQHAASRYIHPTTSSKNTRLAEV
jgi:glycosyltransferase involved in cell wall biosynthesis